MNRKYEPTIMEFIRDSFGFGRRDLSVLFFFFVTLGDLCCCLIKYLITGEYSETMNLAIGYLIIPMILLTIGVAIRFIKPVDREYFLTKSTEKDFLFWLRRAD